MGALGSSVFPQEAIHHQFLGPGVSEHSRVTILRIGQGCFSWLQAIGIGVGRHQFFDIFGSNVFGSRFHEDGRELHRLDPNSRGFIEALGEALETLQRSRRDRNETFVAPGWVGRTAPTGWNSKTRVHFSGQLCGTWISACGVDLSSLPSAEASGDFVGIDFSLAHCPSAGPKDSWQGEKWVESLGGNDRRRSISIATT